MASMYFCSRSPNLNLSTSCFLPFSSPLKRWFSTSLMLSRKSLCLWVLLLMVTVSYFIVVVWQFLWAFLLQAGQRGSLHIRETWGQRGLTHNFLMGFWEGQSSLLDYWRRNRSRMLERWASGLMLWVIFSLSFYIIRCLERRERLKGMMSKKFKKMFSKNDKSIKLQHCIDRNLFSNIEAYQYLCWSILSYQQAMLFIIVGLLVLYALVAFIRRRTAKPNYEGKHVWITGASSGIGEFLAY